MSIAVPAALAAQAEVPCRVCGATRSRLLCRNLNEHSRTGELASYRCAACGSVFIGNAIAPTELEEAYASVDETAYYSETAATSAPKFARAGDDLARLLPASVAVLDIGGGHGAFVRALRARGFGHLSIHEIPGAALPDMTGVAEGIFRDTDYRTIPAAAFDAVCLMDVLEHVADVDATFASVKRVLRPAGLLYAHTPIVSPLDRLMHLVLRCPLLAGIGRAWQRTRTTIFHLQNFAPRALRDAAERHGFDVVRLDRVNELSWPIRRYVRVYLVEKQGLPRVLAPLLAAVLTPLLRSRLNRNKAVLVARLPGPSAAP